MSKKDLHELLEASIASDYKSKFFLDLKKPAEIKDNYADAEIFLQKFEINSVKDIKTYAEIARKYNLSIDSKKVIQAKINMLDYGTAGDFADWLTALCKCGFSIEHVEQYRQRILDRVLELSYETFNLSHIISLLTHAKNLGIFSDEKLQDEEAEMLYDILNYVVEKIVVKNNLSDENYRALFEVALYFKHVLKIDLPEKLQEINLQRDVPNDDFESSDSQIGIFNKIIHHLKRAKGDKSSEEDVEYGWNFTASPSRKSRKIQIGSEGLEIEIEGGYAEIVAGKPIKRGDIILNGAIEFEVDGAPHYRIIDNKRVVIGKTIARNELLFEIFGRKNVVIIGEDKFHHFVNQEACDQFLSSLNQVQRIRKDSTRSLDSAAVTNQSESSSSKEDLNSDEGVSEKLQKEQKKKKVKKIRRDTPKEDEFDFDSLEKVERYETRLKLYADDPDCDLEEVEEFINKNIKSLTSNNFEGKNFLEYLISKDEINLELLILSLITIGQELSINRLALVRAANDKNKQLVTKIIDHFLDKKKEPGASDLNIKKEFEQSFSWWRGNKERLRKLILYDGDFFNIDLSKILINGSRWELEFLCLRESFFSELCKHDAGNFIISHACLENDFNLLKWAVKRGFADKENLKTDKQYCSRLAFHAVSNRNLEMLKFLREQGFFVSTEKNFHVNDIKGRSLLVQAVINEDLEMAKYLVEVLKYDVNEADQAGITPFLFAAKGSNVEMLRYLHSKGADIHHAPDQDLGYGAIDFAAEYGSLEVLAYLHEELGLKVDARHLNDRKIPILCLAVLDDKLDKIRYLINHGVRLNSEEREVSVDPFYFAVQHGKKEMVYLMHQKGARIDCIVDGSNCLAAAIISEDIELVEFLCNEGINIHHRNNLGLSCLDIAVRKANLQIAKLLVAKGAKADASTVCQAVVADNLEMLQFIKTQVDSLEKIDDEGLWPFAMAVTENFFFNSFRFLVEEGVNIDYLRDTEVENDEIHAPTSNSSVKYFFYYLKNVKTVEQLEFIFSNPRTRMFYNFNNVEHVRLMLFFAVCTNNVEIVKYIYDKSLVDPFSHESFCKACELGNFEIVRFFHDKKLKSAKAANEFVNFLKETISTKSREGHYPAHLAIRSNNVKKVTNSTKQESESSLALVEYLYQIWEKYFPNCLNEVNEEGDSLMHLAARSGNFANMNFAIDKVLSMLKSQVKEEYKKENDLRYKTNNKNERPIQDVIRNFSGVAFQQIYLKMLEDPHILLYAIRYNRFEVVRVLAAMMKPEKLLQMLNEPYNSYGETYFMDACLTGNVKMVRFLYERGGDVHKKSNNQVTAIFCALRSGNLDLVKFLLKLHPSIIDSKYLVTRYWNVLEETTLNSSIEVLDYLLKNYAEKFLSNIAEAINLLKIAIGRTAVEKEGDSDDLKLIFISLSDKIREIYKDRPEELKFIYDACWSEAVIRNLECAKRIFLINEGVMENTQKLSRETKITIEELIFATLGDEAVEFSENLQEFIQDFDANHPRPGNNEIPVFNKFLQDIFDNMREIYPEIFMEDIDFTTFNLLNDEDVAKVEEFIEKVEIMEVPSQELSPEGEAEPLQIRTNHTRSTDV